MFCETARRDHGLPFDPFKAIVAPRPIGWIGSISAKGEVNLAPYSFFNGVHSKPNLVMFASESLKDSVANIQETGEFVCSLATWDLRDQMNMTSAPMPRGENEMTRAKLEPAPSRLVKPPRVAASPCALECKMTQIVQLKDADGRPLKRNFVHVDDLVSAILAAIDNPRTKRQLFNVSMDRPVDYGELADYLARTRGLDSIEIPSGFHSNWMDNSKAKYLLAWRPEYGLEKLVDSAWEYERAGSDPRIVYYPG